MTRADVDAVLATTGQTCTIQRQPIVGSDAYGEDTEGDWAAVYTNIACVYQTPSPRGRRVTPETAVSTDERHVWVAGEYAVQPTDRVSTVVATLGDGTVVTLNQEPLTILDVVNDTGLMLLLVCREIT